VKNLVSMSLVKSDQIYLGNCFCPTIHLPSLLAHLLPGLEITMGFFQITVFNIETFLDLRILPHMMNLMQTSNLRVPGSNRSGELATSLDTSAPCNTIQSLEHGQERKLIIPCLLPLKKHTRLQLICTQLKDATHGMRDGSGEEGELLGKLV
jgi:hypothetical protein